MHLNSMMKIVLPLVVWLTELITWIHCTGGIGFGIKREIFFLNLEDGYFGCQVNQSTDVLQLYELSKLCDGYQDCFQGSDELSRELKCTNNCVSESSGLKCQNGACLDSQCHCNDGFGGCSCEVPDENECKYRPCDVFAHCTNTLGSFHCTCFPGYHGDGFHCQDINECDDPALSSRCVANAECCNLPAHFLCKCKPGFEGDGEVECRDINECLQPNICGHNAVCSNTPGNYSCNCHEGYEGNPYNGCLDINECELNACAGGALCTNFPGGFHCECPPGFTGDAYRTGCQDVNECLTNPCGVNALCKNVPGSFQCGCPPGYTGDPFHQCTVIGCVNDKDCPGELSCIQTECQNPCLYSNPCNHGDICQVENHRAICVEGRGGPHPPVPPSCHDCPPGVPCNPETGVCSTDRESETVTTYDDGNLTETGGQILPGDIEESQGSRVDLVTSTFDYADPVTFTAKILTVESTTNAAAAANPLLTDDLIPVTKSTPQETDTDTHIESSGDGDGQPAEGDSDAIDRGVDSTRTSLVTPTERDRWSVSNMETEFETEIAPSNGGSNVSIASEIEEYARISNRSSSDDISSITKATTTLDDQTTTTHIVVNGSTNAPGNPTSVLDDSSSSSSAVPTQLPAANVYVDETTTTATTIPNITQPTTDIGAATSTITDSNESNPVIEKLPEPFVHVENNLERAKNVSLQRVGDGTDVTTKDEIPATTEIENDREVKGQSTISSDNAAKTEEIVSPGDTTVKAEVDSSVGEIGKGQEASNVEKESTFSEGTSSSIQVPVTEVTTIVESIVLEMKPSSTESFAVESATIPAIDGDTSSELSKTKEPEGEENKGSQFLTTVSSQVNPAIETSSNSPNTEEPSEKSTETDHSSTTSLSTPTNQGETISEDLKNTTSDAAIEDALADTPDNAPSTEVAPTEPATSKSTTASSDETPSEDSKPTTLNSDTIGVTSETPTDTATPSQNLEEANGSASYTERVVVEVQTSKSQESNLLKDTDTENPVLEGSNTSENSSKETPVDTSSGSSEESVNTPETTTKSEQTEQETIKDQKTSTSAPLPELGATSSSTETVSSSEGITLPVQETETISSSASEPTLQPTVTAETRPQLEDDVPIDTGTLTPEQSSKSNTYETTSSPQNPTTIDALSDTANLSETASTTASTAEPGETSSPTSSSTTSPIESVETPPPSSTMQSELAEMSPSSKSTTTTTESAESSPFSSTTTTESAELSSSSSTTSTQSAEESPSSSSESSETSPPSTSQSEADTTLSPSSATSSTESAESSSISKSAETSPLFSSTIEYDSTESSPSSTTTTTESAETPPSSSSPSSTTTTKESAETPPSSSSESSETSPPATTQSESATTLQPPSETNSSESATTLQPPSEASSSESATTSPPSTSDSTETSPPSSIPKSTITDSPDDNKSGTLDPSTTQSPLTNCTSPYQLNCTATSKEIRVQTTGNKTTVIIVRTRPLTSSSNHSCTSNLDCPRMRICLNNICTLKNNSQLAKSGLGLSLAETSDFLRGSSRKHHCELDSHCNDTEVCVNHVCEDTCHVAKQTHSCAPTAKCHAVKHRPVCTCPAGYRGNPSDGCYLPQPLSCHSNLECSVNEVCLKGVCQLPCSIHNPCAEYAVCLNTHRGPDCSCQEGYQGNGFVGCIPVDSVRLICQYNEDCPPEKLCDRLNRVCINPCFEDSCGENAECVPKNHKIDCRCPHGTSGNPYISCTAVTGCQRDEDCASNEACIQGKCGNPCRCGPNAICDVLYHRASCKCLPGYNGNPNEGCLVPQNPCKPNPCGMHAECELDNGNPVCFCPKGMTGNPFKQCIPEGDDCRPNPCGPNSGCKVVRGSALCFCLPQFEGDPPSIPCQLPQNPCNPSPCGPNTQCTLLSTGYAKCTCLNGYVESTNTIRGCVEKKNPCDPNPCGYGAICDPNRTPCCFCPENTVGNPYKHCEERVRDLCKPGPCGPNADCYVTGSTEQCFCKQGFQGDPYTSCQLIPHNPCNPNPCGPYATCTVSHDGQPLCNCPPGIVPDSNGGCTGFECTIDEDCPFNKACVAYKCQDPCPGSCGIGASCRVEKHHPVCTCNHGLTGNPLTRCYLLEAKPEPNPCHPYPCGPNTYCKVSNKRAVCTCMENFIGDAKKGCKPECVLNTDCGSDRVCINYQCKDPCGIKSVCGLGAVCLCRDHMPTCICREGFTGNPFIQCVPKPTYPSYPNTTLPCTPSPCDPTNTCHAYGTEVAMCDPCTSPNGYYNPSCHPECLYNADCPFNLACLGQKCLDPCVGACGINSHCMVVKHSPICSCPETLTGNPYEHCTAIKTPPVAADHCHRDRCGANAICKNNYGHIICECARGYFGNPYLACRPECVINTDCPQTKACLNNKCINPCSGVCGVNAECQVINHQPICYCPQGHTGDASLNCYPDRTYLPPLPPVKPSNPCDPSPCGANSRCLISPEGYAVCSCLPGYRGSPPLCKPECVVSTECALVQCCINHKCSDPCPGTCGIGAQCFVINHNPICSCPPGHVGDPFVMCVLPPAIEEPKVPSNPCDPNPCGPNSICQIREGHPVCSCIANYLGSPPYCRPECVLNQECPFDKACIHEKCQNPCAKSCGLNAKCDVVNHTPYCTCLPGYEGDAFISCSRIPPTVQPPVPKDPCRPSPCGENAQCSYQEDGIVLCTCIPPYIGNPYSGCRPECVMNSDCAPNAACLSSHCRDPCPGVCGNNAECTVVNHIPVCTCFPDHVGNPFQSCRRKPIAPPPPPRNPCDPSPCGPNSRCEISHSHALCSCNQGFIGTPPNCRPECVTSAECSPSLACIAQKCADPCPGTCGLHARCNVINHNPICSCPPNTVGDPFVRCVQEEPHPPPVPYYPCHPSPCGANSECKEQDGRPVCSCLAGMLGTPPYCRPECLIHADCPTKLACLNNKCRDPCIGSCGFNAQCSVVNHQPICSCHEGYQGDPFSGCNAIAPIPTETPDPCHPSPCGSNAVCKERNGAGSCQCLPEYSGDPYTGCRPECVLNSECPHDKACVNNKCINPCIGVCGSNAECRVINHAPSCSCVIGYTGNPLVACHPTPKPPPPRPERPRNPCIPSPCGPYSECRQVDNHAVCSCQKNYIGSPPACRPECMVSSECAQNKACIKQKCQDPCIGTCGYNARCQVVSHNPICSCSPGFTGDPFVRCVKEEPVKTDERNPSYPCTPSPCGPNSQCRVVGSNPACSCLENYIGRPPNCRPECTINEECPPHLACQNERCRDPCIGSCGAHSTCVTVKHSPHCNCEIGYTGDPFAGCILIVEVRPPESPQDPCVPSPCGANAVCKQRNGAGSCLCLPEYYGDPYTGCRPECVTNSDCDRSKACFNNKCKDPCIGTCGLNAECRVINHAPSCTCYPDYIGDPINACHPKPKEDHTPRPTMPCVPSPCGPYSECRQVNDHAVCSCQKNYVGSPPACRPECMVSSECPQDKACIRQRCVDPCPGTCSPDARCQVVNHNAICSCSPGYTGDPFVRCIKIPQELPPPVPSNPCVPSPCGPYSECRIVGNTPACSCQQDYVGRPPNCRPECTINAECPGTLACINERCKDPCPGSCGIHAVCAVSNHAPRCTCENGYTGDPFSGCSPVPIAIPTEAPKNPCVPSPCGANAVCKERNGAGSCICLPEYYGDPYTGCRPECVTNSDCDPNRACLNNKCKDPCPGTCGLYAECRVINHAPSCSCLPGYTGDPISACHQIQEIKPEYVNPCTPSPCGPYSKCREINGHAVCSCQKNYIGTPPACRPECMVSSECAQNKACINQKCVDPCPGTCGQNARCQVVNHNPICSCPTGYTGDPFVRCVLEQRTTTARPSGNPCVPSPCGPYSDCRVINNVPACSCLTNYIGQPPNCRPECVINAECPSNLACKNEKCIDPCPGSCGHLAKCYVINHNSVCTCPPGYTGNALVECHPEPSTEANPPEPINPCYPNPCGVNAECVNKNEAAACRCITGYFGDPYSGCKRECETNNDCHLLLSCIGYKCVDPCPGTCGSDSICTVVNHIPICSCPPEYTGDPFFQCRPIPLTPKPPTQDPCYPSPCGPNSQCRAVNQQAVCTCLPTYVGSPPNCRPECVVSSECPLDKACINQKCADPCPNTCGLYALCNVKNHNPYCSCPPQYTGDPFSQCLPIPPSTQATPTDAPPSCVPSPCGPNSQCKIINGSPVCSCLPDFIGSPPSCRPECVISSECPSQLACINQHCRDPCPGSCGVNANCYVLNHVPVCTCNDGHTGDPFNLCSPIPITTPAPINPCSPSPCGPNAICHGGGICECLPEYTGNPYESCRPECVISSECPRDKACIRNKCQNPCIGTCGQNANCDVINHIPTCSCPPNMIGDPFFLCRPKPEAPPVPLDPCSPSPCGPNSICRNNNGQAVCSCLPSYQGTPPSCKPECIVSEECSSVQACVNKKCINPCIGVCGYGARCEVINHSPICSCRESQTGDPFKSCYDLPPQPIPEPTPQNPCVPSPCGPNSHCLPSNHQPTCSCLQGFVGAPPNCRPECVINSDCPRNLACINNKCRDPCPGSCGLNAQCQVISNTVSCSCLPGYVGNPFEQCQQQITEEEELNPCEPSPCGVNAICKQQNGAGSCSCIAGYQGNPYEGCRPECVLSSDCPSDKACIRNKCQNPCPGICGVYASCTVINHIPNCNCEPGYIGDPFSGCRLKPIEAPLPSVNPCNPSPCGPNSRCVERNDQAICSCLPNYQGSPPDCRPECVVNSECPTNRACYKYKCTDPCPGTCGINARCEVIKHRPICSCPAGFTGDPFQRCYQALPEVKPPVQPINPCVPSPCGPYSECHVIGSQASCRCRENYIGGPPNCRPECVVNTDCSPTLACISEKCRDPCIGSCGLNAECRVHNHIPTCTCIPQHTGDPFTQCTQIVIIEHPPTPTNPCSPSPCGANANCNNGVCTCITNYFGDPYGGCRPECTMNTDCSPNKACINLRCVDPCIGICGQDAKCDVVNHIPTCSCPPTTSGDAFVACRPIVHVDIDPCNPSPCGPNSICRVIDNHAVCSCQPGLIGAPPSCRPECVTSAECSLTQACLMQKCKDPCPGTCGLNAKCHVINHNPICSCPPGYNGDPFRHCQLVPALPPTPPQPLNPCAGSPCGPNAICQVHGDIPACSCLTNYIGSPPNCRPECTINPECPPTLACINQRCADPCTGSCGFNAVCSVVNHAAVCSCIQGYTGDPFASCALITEQPPTPIAPVDPCYPSPCGPNARCRTENGFAVCECLPEYQGNPYENCRPECLISSDCAMNKACIRNKCQDPCPGTCGLSAICSVSNHIPICYCPEGTTGDAFRICEPIPRVPIVPSNPCYPSPCGPNTNCRVSNNVAVCECIPGFEGSPTSSGCHPECVINADCPRNRACINNKCVDPCPGVCGYKAVCQTLNHSPVCSCPSPLVGDPFSECKEAPAAPVDPCNPSPCGRNGQCRVVGGVASCTYPECIINQDCPRDKACFGQKCKDPCVGACGINAICQVVNHDAACSCPPGYYGEPRLQCRQETAPEPKPECVSNSECSNNKACINHACRDPCAESANVCAVNAECRVQQHRPYCFCRDGLTGNPQSYCYEIGCRSDIDCLPTQACVNRECTDPCAYTQCGVNALCRVDNNHKGRCHCPETYFGNPLVSCERPQCTSDPDCPGDLACINQKCQNPCNCAPSALCTVVGHKPNCRCPPGYTGNPYTSCTIAPIETPVECKMDADCSSKLACFSGMCKNPCLETKPCGANAECSVVDTLPLRTMTCLCLPGYVGDADVQCRKDQQRLPGCESNDECPLSDICINRQCNNPCTIRNPCAPNANCLANNHKATCRCPEGLVGDPFTNCYKVPPALPECTTDSDCPSTRACINEKCQEPCAISNPCGIFAECNTLQHRPVCNCPDGWAGNPQVHCYKPECKSDSDCLYDKACRNNNCVSPCASISCGIAAQCTVQAHVPQCVCPTGTQGNPLLSCVSVGCQYNEDCADHEACDRLNRKCRPVCESDTCAVNAICTAKNHQPICNCLPNTQGNPYVECSGSRQTPQCEKDSECPSKLTCIDHKCQDPCRQAGRCSPDKECIVQDTYPVRTVMCVCPPDTISSNDGHCKAIVPIECKADSECNNIERCVRGSCIEACRIDPCGRNAICNANNHYSVCSCPPHYVGNPHVECTSVPTVPIPSPIPECTRDDDCPFNLGCNNQRCVSPCSLDGACGRGSFCHVQNHEPVCRCPPGYTGNPSTECIPPTETQIIGCVSNSECSPEESCINKLCVNPCNCGPNADCRVIGHYPMCYCKPGYSGNPQYGCVKVGCESDDQCSYDKVCYNGDCVNPCLIHDPCAITAQCYGDNHRTACKCPPGYKGDPFVKCEPVECHIDADCPQDRMCVEQQCINPCTDTRNPPCAPNAICYVRNHATGCRCPDYLPIGNPLAYCERAPPPTPAEPECRTDANCPSKLACIREHCVNPCVALTPCTSTAKCSVLDSVPVRTLTCTCPDGWIPNKEGECKPVVVSKTPGCDSNDDCPSNETCINRVCRNPCNCGLNSQCFVQNHRPICSCKDGYEGNPNTVCKLIGCRRDSECESGRACINGNCINPCIIKDPCGPNAECYVIGSAPQCRCLSGFRGNPYERCNVVGCRSNNDCPEDRSCINGQCINPCAYEHPCSPQAQCQVKNHIALCRCPPGMIGNPYTYCQEEERPECREDADCPALLACFNKRCQNPCAVLEPCQRPSQCEVVNTLPMRTMICVCPSGYISSGSGTCKTIPAITDVACTADSQCPSDRACINGICINPCDCGPNAECHIKNHKPVCSCIPGYEGNPNLECVAAGCKSDSDCSGQHMCRNHACVPACAPDGTSCGTSANCYGIQHRAVCECPPGLVGNPQVACSLVTCKSDSDCPSDRSCINKKCVNPCAQSKECVEPAICVPLNHKADCACPPGYLGSVATGCELPKSGCRSDSECPSQQACINDRCINPCAESQPCGTNAICTTFDTVPVKTMICECPPGYEGNAVIACAEIPKCPVEKGFIRDEHGNCVCPPGTALNAYEECRHCVPELGYKIDESGHCVCALERGLIVNSRGECVCPPEHGYELDYFGNCIPKRPPGCDSNDDCPDHLYCINRRCENPCEGQICGKNAYCNATDHQAICTCPPNHHGNPEVECVPTARKDEFPKPEMVVSCLSDGVQVRMELTDAGFNGVLYVKGHSKEEECRRLISVPTTSPSRTEIFKVLFGSCGLIHVNGQASFVLVIQKHPKLVTYKAQAYHIKCVYATTEQNVTIGFNVSMLTTAGTIANTGPPPTCMMKIVTSSGQEISSAEIGENLMLQVDVHPTSIYGGFARSCVAKTLDNNVENEYIVTDENGCATDPNIFKEWEYNPETQSLTAEFNAFKFPSSDNIRFQCNIRVCFGRCQPVNCRGFDAFGRRRKREISNGTDIDVLHEGQLREEITIESNAIFTVERREERLVNPTEEPQTAPSNDICISIIGLIVALIITALLALVAVAVSVSCWLMAYRRQPSMSGPLPHPTEFPNPIYTSSQPVSESNREYLA